MLLILCLRHLVELFRDVLRELLRRQRSAPAHFGFQQPPNRFSTGERAGLFAGQFHITLTTVAQTLQIRAVLDIFVLAVQHELVGRRAFATSATHCQEPCEKKGVPYSLSATPRQNFLLKETASK